MELVILLFASQIVKVRFMMVAGVITAPKMNEIHKSGRGVLHHGQVRVLHFLQGCNMCCSFNDLRVASGRLGTCGKISVWKAATGPPSALAANRGSGG